MEYVWSITFFVPRKPGDFTCTIRHPGPTYNSWASPTIEGDDAEAVEHLREMLDNGYGPFGHRLSLRSAAACDIDHALIMMRQTPSGMLYFELLQGEREEIEGVPPGCQS